MIIMDEIIRKILSFFSDFHEALVLSGFSFTFNAFLRQKT